MSGGWDDALEAQNELRASFHTVPGARYMERFERGLMRRGKQFRADDDEIVIADGSPATANQAVQTAIETVERGIPMWVSEDVVELIEFASRTWRPEPLLPTHLITTQPVFALLGRPLAVTDQSGNEVTFRALSWMQAVFTDDESRGVVDIGDGAHGVALALWSHCDDDDAKAQGARVIGGSYLSLMHSGIVPYAREVILTDDGYRQMVAYFQVMSRLAMQEIVVPARERASRPVWRRKSNWRQIKEVNVLRLRRAKPPKYEGPEREIEWSHRWMVGLGTGGFWRNQWYPKLQQHCQIWIMPYVKGPDDKPLIIKKTAIEFDR